MELSKKILKRNCRTGRKYIPVMFMYIMMEKRGVCKQANGHVLKMPIKLKITLFKYSEIDQNVLSPRRNYRRIMRVTRNKTCDRYRCKDM